MPNPNISAAITAAQKTTMKGNVDTNKAIIAPFSVNLTPEQRRTILKAGGDSVSFVQDCLQVAKDNPITVPGDMTTTEYEKDVVLFTDTNELELHHLPYMEMLSDLKMAVGSEAIRQSNRIYEMVKSLAKNDSNFETIRKQLAKRYELLTGPKKKFVLQKVVLAPKSSVSLMNVAAESPFTNDGATTLLLCDGAVPNCTSGVTVNSGASTKVASGVTSITVTNQSDTTNGSFTVKVEG